MIGKDLTDKKFGQLTVRLKTRIVVPDRYYYWLCRCDCGKEILASTRQLQRGMIKDCGCVPRKATAQHGSIAEDLSGRQFGFLTVAERVKNVRGRVAWKCICICGNEIIVTAHDLKQGSVKSCGCRTHNGTFFRDLQGEQIGWLTVLEKLDARDGKGSIMWRCRCKCGKECEYSADSLLHGGVVSCGCYRRTMISPSNGLHRLEGTCVEKLLPKKARSDSQTGVVGVSPARCSHTFSITRLVLSRKLCWMIHSMRLN